MVNDLFRMVGLESNYTMMTTKNPQTLKEKIFNKIAKPLLYTISMSSLFSTLMYALPFPMINLWDLFVEFCFGSFWLAVFFIALIYFILLMMAGISYYTVIIFMLFYFLAMSIGYGYPLFTAFITIFAIIYMIYQIFRVLENR